MNPRVQPPAFITKHFPDAVWNIPGKGKNVYLTFDDGPIPNVTPWVLELLEKEKIQATFFCVGENVYKNQDIFLQIKEKGHRVGNHTYNHLTGLKTQNYLYYKNVEKADELINSDLFRPPHGLLSKQQYKFLSLKYKIIMWDVISCDYDSRLSGEKIVKNVLEHIRPGSIMVFHDSLKAENNLYYALPKVIESLKEQDFTFGEIESDKQKL